MASEIQFLACGCCCVSMIVLCDAHRVVGYEHLLSQSWSGSCGAVSAEHLNPEHLNPLTPPNAVTTVTHARVARRYTQTC